MANCPKCDYHLRLRDWRPNCPSCGVNLVYYGMEERLLADADKAEAEHSHFQKKIDRVKASFVGSKFAIARIVLTVLPIGFLFLPLANMVIKAPYINDSTNISILKIGMKVAELDFGGLLTLMKSDIVGNSFTMLFAALACMLVTAVAALFGLIMLFLSCSPKGLARNFTLSSIGFVLTGAAAFLFTKFSASFAEFFPGAYSGNLKFGIFVLMASFALVIIINAVIAKVGINVKYKQTYIGGIPSAEYFAAKAAGIDVLSLQTHVSEEEAAEAVEKALEEKGIAPETIKKEAVEAEKAPSELEKGLEKAAIAQADVPATEDADIEARANEGKPEE